MAKSKKPLIGYMILEDYAEDMSDFSGQICGPDDPTGCNAYWDTPIKMIEYSAFEKLASLAKDAVNAQRDGDHHSMAYVIDELDQALKSLTSKEKK